ncbi:hypothetical protein F4680DRAFT_470356 [Xylaria scruposa]|nr:hypothetical protein F4680DRAFT_470356 [Xylaria scruposa]
MPHRRQICQPQDDVWKQNETTFRRLYLRERKPLKDVKKVMESEHEFPITPLSTYESKLRSLGLRKKMKKKDWYPVYQDYVNSGRRHTAIYFNGARIPWDKAWKEIRRSGARERNDCHIAGLPADVVMRSPSPDMVSQSAITSCRVPIPWHLSDISLVALNPTAMVHRSSLYEVPSNLLRVNMQNIFEQCLATVRVKSSESSYDHRSILNTTNLGIESTLVNKYSSLSHQISEFMDVNSSIDKLSGALYRLANRNMSNPFVGKQLDESLELIINKTSKYVLLKILENESGNPTVQAAVEMLLVAFSHLGRKEDFHDIIEVLCRSYLNRNLNDRYLIYAGRLGCVDSCRLLLQRRPKGTVPDPLGLYVKAVLDSIAKGNVECAKVMFEHVLNQENVIANGIFGSFLSAVARGSYELELNIPTPFGRQSAAARNMLEWFLEVGADVDLPARYLSARYLPVRYLSVRHLSATCITPNFVSLDSHKNVKHAYYTRYTPKNWMPTALDYLFFENLELYSCLVDRSTRFKTEFTRSGIHHSAGEGIDSLRTYLLSRLSHTPAQQDELLEICLTEEFLRPETNDNVNFNVISTLLDYNMGLQKLRMKLSLSAMLYYTIKAASRQGMHPAVYHIVEILILREAVIIAETMDEAVETEGTTLLQLLSSYGADFKNLGAMALCTALKLNNHAAVSLLLEIGVNVNATLRESEQEGEMTILAYANICTRRRTARLTGWGLRRMVFQAVSLINCEMLEYLISRNVKLRANLADNDTHRLLYLVIRNGLSYGDWEDTFNKTKVLLDAEPLIYDQPRAAPCLLELCFSSRTYAYEATQFQRISFLNYLIDHGIPINHSGILTYLILHHGPENEIQKLLDSGVDVNAYSGVDVNAYSGENLGIDVTVLQYTSLQAAAAVGSLDLVRLLVQRDADMNRPAKGDRGRTALQAACERVSLGAGRSRIVDLIKFLIACGADINAPPASVRGVTALQAAAMGGDFEIVLLLLDNGADINAPPPDKHGFCALDGAAILGRLDMVQFLLSLGALSYQGGESGYREAIRCAEYDYPPIADMIRQYALKNGKSGEELFAHCQQWENTSSEAGDDSDVADEVGDTCFENQEFWEDWLP